MSLLVDYLFVPAMHFARYCVGYRGKTVRVDEFEWSFMEREASTPSSTVPVVLLHGFSSWKESLTGLAWHIDKKHRVIVPDLPGHGETTPADPGMSFTATDQADRLHRFLETTIPQNCKIHLVGCSMGGMLAGVYAAKYPDRVWSLTLMCPAGITMPNKSEVYRMLDDEEKNLLLAKTADDMAELSALVAFKPATIPRVILSMVVKHREKSMAVFEKIFQDSKTDPTVLEDQLHRIQARTLIFWGMNDRILDISSLPILEQKLANVPEKQTVVFDECGHTVQNEKYEECAKAINRFLESETS